MSCLFCRIALGEIPSARVLESAKAFAFLDINPLAEGHLLLIPKEHYERVSDMPGQDCADVLSHLPSLGHALMKITGAEGFNVLQNNGEAAGQEIKHVHFHLIPRRERDGLGYRWKPQSSNKNDLDALASQIAGLL